ncbi:MAG: hypothetical protein ACFB0G_05255 [Leptolyngbyaceae cyanobacterium]
MLSQEQALAERDKTWQFLELWVDPALFPPRVLMLIGDRDGSCRIFKPDANYQLVVTHSDYEAAKDWLLEDEYERIESQLLAEEIF